MPPYFDELRVNLDNFDPLRFGDELLADAGLDDAQREAIKAALAKPAVSSKLRNAVALRSDASRALDQARARTLEAERVRDENMRWAEANKEPLGRFIASGGRFETVQTPSGETLSKADVVELFGDYEKKLHDALAEKDEQYVGLLADTVELSAAYSKEFPGESLPYGELQQFAISKRMSLRNAFPLFIEPKLTTKRKAEFEAAIAAAREEGRLEGLGQREDPVTAESGGEIGSAFKDALLGRRTTTLTNTDGQKLEGEAAFVANWNKTQGFTKPLDPRSH